MQNCPACRARYKGQPMCTRCGADLTLPLLSEQQAMELLRQAVQYLSNKDYSRAAIALQQARLLKQTPLAIALDEFLQVKIHEPSVTDEAARLESIPVEEPQIHSLLQDWLTTRKHKWDNFHPDLSLWKKQVLQRKSVD